MDNLEGRERFSSSRGHDNQYSVLAFRNGFHRAVDSNPLVIAGLMRIDIKVVWLLDNLLFFWCVPLEFEQTLFQLLRSRELVKTDVLLNARSEIIFGKAISIGAVGKFEVQDLSIGFGLSNTAADRVIVVFRFDNGYRELIRFGLKKIVGKLLRLSGMRGLALEYNASIREGIFHPDVLFIPPGTFKRRCNELQFYVLFGQLLFVCHRM